MQIKSVKLMSYQLLNCLLEHIPPMLAMNMPFAINGVARSNIPVHSLDIANVTNETTAPRKSEKKKASKNEEE